ncbi:uncharacterized protein CCOS01_15899, partial [Colletotrichum costaricense]
GRWFPAVPSGSSTRPRQRRHWLGVPSAILARWQAPLKFHCFILRHPTPVAPCALRACASRTGIHVGVHGLSPVSAPCALGPSDFTRPSAPATTQLSAALAHLPGESPCGGVGTSRSGTAFFSPGCLREAKTLGLEARRNPSATSKSPKWHRWLVIFIITLRMPRTIDVGMAMLELDIRKNKKRIAFANRPRAISGPGSYPRSDIDPPPPSSCLRMKMSGCCRSPFHALFMLN